MRGFWYENTWLERRARDAKLQIPSSSRPARELSCADLVHANSKNNTDSAFPLTASPRHSNPRRRYRRRSLFPPHKISLLKATQSLRQLSTLFVPKRSKSLKKRYEWLGSQRERQRESRECGRTAGSLGCWRSRRGTWQVRGRRGRCCWRGRIFRQRLRGRPGPGPRHELVRFSSTSFVFQQARFARDAVQPHAAGCHQPGAV